MLNIENPFTKIKQKRGAIVKPIMEFNIIIHPEEITRMETPSGKVTVIPFSGNVESELFTGTIRPGAADVQVTNAAGIRHMNAKYIFEGKDKNGKDCYLFVDNNGYFVPNREPSPFHAYPTFMSDSPFLADILERSSFRAEGHPAKEGVTIKIFNVLEKAN